MRVGAIILFYNGLCYQSYNWKILRPLGDLQTVIDFLEDYEVDEISIIRPIRSDNSIELFNQDIKIIKNIKTMTPLSFGGGIRNYNIIQNLHNLPIERLIFSSVFLNKNIDLITYAKKQYGHQAIQCLLPFKIYNKNVYIFNTSLNMYVDLSSLDIDFINQHANEIILYNTISEGDVDSFQVDILEYIGIDKHKLVFSGGIGQQDIKIGLKHDIASVLIDNKTLHKEYSIKGYKNGK